MLSCGRKKRTNGDAAAAVVVRALLMFSPLGQINTHSSIRCLLNSLCSQLLGWCFADGSPAQRDMWWWKCPKMRDYSTIEWDCRADKCGNFHRKRTGPEHDDFFQFIRRKKKHIEQKQTRISILISAWIIQKSRSSVKNRKELENYERVELSSPYSWLATSKAGWWVRPLLALVQHFLAAWPHVPRRIELKSSRRRHES